VLPNASHPTAIGKPGEQIHAVRFVNERAYVVTARVTDPLYVIEIVGIGSDAAELEFRGLIKTAEPDGTTYLPAELPNRSVLHDDSVFAIRGSRIMGRLIGDMLL